MTDRTVPETRTITKPLRRRRRWEPRQVLSRIGLGIVAFLAMAPILWLLLTSIKPRDAIVAPEPVFFFVPTFEHYELLFSGARGSVFLYFSNSVIVSVVTTVVSVSLAAVTAYSLARLKPRGHKQLGLIILSLRMLPPIAMVVPFYLIATTLGTYDTLIGLIAPYIALAIPLATWLLQGFFLDLPKELEEAALIDGCTLWGAFIRVILPLAAPGLAAVAVFSFILPWNDLVLALPLTQFDAQTLPLFASRARTEEGIAWGYLGAVASVIIIPVVIFTALVHRWLVSGLAGGAVKG